MNVFKRSLVRLLRLTSPGHQLLNLYLIRKLLKRNGWLKSAEKGRSINAEGEAIPWYTYSFLHFLEGKVKEEMRIFEYGSGYSTIWWAKRASSVVACEHDAYWYQSLKSKLPANVVGHHVPLDYDGEYSKCIKQYSKEFDIVIIDGRDRNHCAMNAVPAMKEHGILIWDNSDRARYSEGMEHLKKLGFKQLEFYGLGPTSAAEWGTSIFYRTANCFNI